MLNVVLACHPTEDVREGQTCGLLALDELNAVVGQDRVDRIGHVPDQGFQEPGRHQFRSLAVDAREHQFAGPIDCNEEEALAAS